MSNPINGSRPQGTTQVPPIILPLLGLSGAEQVAHFAIALGRPSGARVIFIQPPSTRTKGAGLSSLNERIKKFAANDVRYANINVHKVPKKTAKEAQIASLEHLVLANEAATVIVPVEREALMREGTERNGIEWTKDLPNEQILFVHGTDKPFENLGNRPIRVLVPIIHDLNQRPFELACALNNNSNVPDVEVIAVRVLELPTHSSQYSIYSQDSHSIGDEHLAFIKTHLSRPMQRLVRPMVLPVHHGGIDVATFAKDREMDFIIMEGKWWRDGQEILTPIESDIVAKASCTIVVTMAHRTNKEKDAEGPDAQEP